MVTARLAQGYPLDHAKLGARTLLGGIAVAALAPAQVPAWLPQELPPIFGHAIALDAHRERLVLFGGADASSDLDGTWERSGDRWWRCAPPVSPPPRREHALAFDSARGVMVLFGGSHNGTELGECWLYDGETWTLRTPTLAPGPRYGAAMTFDAARSRCVLFGGWGQGTLQGDTWEWDGTSWTLRSPAHAPTARYGHAMVWSPAALRTLLFGGSDTAGLQPTPRNDTWEWDGVDWLQRATAHSPPVRWRHALAADPLRSRVVLFGGDDSSARADAWEWDGIDWQQVAGLAVARLLAAGTWSPHDAAVLAVGGAVNASNGYIPVPHPVDDVPRTFDGTAWRQLAPWGCEGSAFDSARAAIVALESASDGALWRWNGQRWLRDVASPPWGNTADVAYDATRQRLVFMTQAGYTTGGQVETWEFGNGLASLLGVGMTPRPIEILLAFDAARSQTLCPTQVGTLTWQGAGWSSPSANSPPRDLGLVFDPVAQAVLAVGAGTATTEVWQWNGNTWTLRHATNAGPRGRGRTIFDGARQRFVSHVTSSGTTWEWDGTTWTQLPASVPALGGPRGMLVRDPVRQQTLLVTDRTWLLSATPAAATAYGSACGAAAPTLLAFGTPRLGRTDFAFDVYAHANAPTPVVVALSLHQGTAPIPGGCTLWLASIDAAAFALTDARGFATLRLPIPDDARLRGTAVFAQAGALVTAGLQTSGGLRLVLGD